MATISDSSFSSTAGQPIAARSLTSTSGQKRYVIRPAMMKTSPSTLSHCAGLLLGMKGSAKARLAMGTWMVRHSHSTLEEPYLSTAQRKERNELGVSVVASQGGGSAKKADVELN